MNDLTADFADFVQADRTIRIETPLGADVLLPERAELTEGVNGLFEFRVAVRSKNLQIQAAEIVGHLADVSLDLDGTGARRTWNALVVEMHEQPNVMRGFRRYVLTLRPQLWLMSQKSDCRIWQDKTTIDVLNTLMGEHGLPAAQVSLLQPVPPQHYSVQFNETDLDYLRRRFEEDGLFFWHTHEPGQHTLNVADSAVAWKDAEPSDVRFSLGSSDKNNITAWSKRYLYTPGVRSGADWNFQTPTTVPLGKTNSLVQLPRNGSYELYEYPARVATADEADRATKLRMQATEVDHARVEGASLVRTLAPAERFTPYDLSNPDPPYQRHALLEVTHTLVDRTYEPDETAPDYENTFVALPSGLSATPHRATRRPRVDGTQTAIIAGPAGEEIFTDEFGRIRVWFPWDRRAKKDGSDTCWIRVIQSWGGSGWGGQVIPRIGMEAMVAYQDGDPDRPVVVGLVPNPSKGVTYGLPDNKTKTMFRTNTHKGPGFNELSFEDFNGQQNVLIHAQKDFTQKVLNNQTARVDNSHALSVGGHASTEVAGNASLQTGGSQSTVVGATGPDVAAALAPISALMSNTAARSSQAAGVVGGLGGSAGLAGGLISDAGPAQLSGDGLKGRSGVNDGGTTAADMGKALTGSGSQLLQGVGGLFGGAGGTQSNVVTGMKIDTVGVLRTETVGTTKVTNVGGTFFVGVGHTYQIDVGEKMEIIVGAASITLTKDGTIAIKGVKFEFTASGVFDMVGKPINLNPPGA